MWSRSSMTASKFGLASLSLGGAHSLEDDDEECEWFPSLSLGTLGMSPDGIPMHSSSAWSGLPAPELTAACARGMTVSNLFGDEFRDTLLGGSETLVSNVVHRSLKPAKTSSCVCDATHQKLHDMFFSACIFDSWTLTSTSRDRYDE